MKKTLLRREYDVNYFLCANSYNINHLQSTICTRPQPFE